MSEAQRGARLRRKAQRSAALRPAAAARRTAEGRRAPDLASRALHARREARASQRFGSPGWAGPEPAFKRVDPAHLYLIKTKKKGKRMKKGRKKLTCVRLGHPTIFSQPRAAVTPPRRRRDVAVQVLSPPLSSLFPPPLLLAPFLWLFLSLPLFLSFFLSERRSHLSVPLFFASSTLDKPQQPIPAFKTSHMPSIVPSKVRRLFPCLHQASSTIP